MPVTTRLADMRGLMPIGQTHTRADPQEVYRELRAEWGEVAPVELAPGINGWLVMGYEELSFVVRNERLFVKSSLHWRDYAEGRIGPDSPLGPFMFPRPSLWMADGDDHRRLRAPVEDALQGLRLREVRRQVTEVCDALIADFPAGGEADLVRQYALPVPTMVMGMLLGLDLPVSRKMHQGLMALLAVNEEWAAGTTRFEGILAGLVLARKAQPVRDMTSVIVQHPGMASDEERMHTMVTAITAASGTTMAWIGQTLQLMLTDARFSGRMRGGRLGIDDALEEVLWRETPVANLPGRYALRDTVLGGQPIERGDALILGLAAANGDPRTHGADQQIEVGNHSHLSFSAGPHMCPAHVPARVIVRTSVEIAFHRLPCLRLTKPLEELGRLESPWMRCPATLPVTFTR